MKKSAIALVLILGLCLTFVGCTNGNEPDSTIPSASDNADTNPQSSSPEKTSAEETSSTEETSSIKLIPAGGSEDFFGIKKYKYRYNYYRITAHYIDIVGAEAYFKWFESNPDFAKKNLDEMLMVSYIKHFGITREQFDAASQMRKDFYEENGNTLLIYPFENDGEYSYDDEADEIYNADIIYTFDNELINEYYARPPELIIENGTNALGEPVD